jgi:hypothetical protein
MSECWFDITNKYTYKQKLDTMNVITNILNGNLETDCKCKNEIMHVLKRNTSEQSK